MSTARPPSKSELQTELAELNKNIAAADSQISAAHRTMVLHGFGNCIAFSAICACGIVMCLAGAAMQAEGFNNFSHGNFFSGVLDLWCGMNVMQTGANVAISALAIPAGDSNWSAEQNYSHYSQHRDRLATLRLVKQKQLYELEKNETLKLLDSDHPYYESVVKQFTAIDANIAANKFDPVYVDIAANTNSIISTEDDAERNRYLERHMSLATESSVGKKVAGAMLGLVSIVIITASVAAAAVSFGLLAPLSILGFTLAASTAVSAISITTGCVGLASLAGSAGLFASGFTKRRSTVPQEAIDVANFKPEPLISPRFGFAPA